MRRITTSYFRRASVLVLASAFLADAAGAQALDASGGTPAEADAVAADVPTDEIIVTARKRAENVQDVPDSIAVLGGALLEQAGIDNLDEAADLIPNLTLVDSQDAGTVAINIRGIGQVRNGEAPVAINVDGVQLVSADAIKQSLFDLERIEVLKGPQGSLYGRNAIGGAVNIITRAPTNDFEGKAKAEYANGEDIRLNGSVSGPIVPDLLLFRLSGDFRDFGGVIHNVTLDREMDFVRDVNLRGRLLFTPGENLKFDLRVSHGDLKGGASWYIPLPDGQPNNTTAKVVADVLGRSDRESLDVALKSDLELGGVTLTSITAWSDVDFDFFEDLDWTAAAILTGEQSRDVKSFNQEFRVTSASDQPFRWVAGLSYLDSERSIDTILGISMTGTPPYAQVPVAGTTEDSEVWGGYAQANWDLTPRLELTAGLRYDEDHREQLDRLGTAGRRDTTFKEWQPKLSLAYDLTEDALIYATVARGFRSGGFNPPTNDFPAIYDAETTTNFEVGAKTSWLDRALTLNLSAFRIEYNDQHVFILKVANQGIVNIKKTEILGFELEANARPTERLQFTASLGLIDSEIKNFDGSDLYRGNQVPLTYGWSYALSGQYRLPFDNWDLVTRVEYTGKGDNYWHIDNDDRQKSVHLVDARISAEFDSFTLTAYAENLFDKEYTEEFFAQQFSALGSDIRYPGTPRRYGVSATFRF